MTSQFLLGKIGFRINLAGGFKGKFNFSTVWHPFLCAGGGLIGND